MNNINTKEVDFINDLTKYSISPVFPQNITNESGEELYNEIIKDGFIVNAPEKQIQECDPKKIDLLRIILTISTWLFCKFPNILKPYYFKSKFQLLIA